MKSLRPHRFFNTPLTLSDFRQRKSAFLNALKTVLAQTDLQAEALQQHQETRLKQLLKHAYSSIPFYRQLYDQVGFHPDEFLSLSNLSLIPMVTKTMLRKADPATLQPADTTRNLYLSTSGSTGEPVGLYKSNESLWLFMAAAFIQYRHWSRFADLKSPLYILDETPGNIDYVLGDLLRTFAMEDRFLSAFANVQHIHDAIETFQPDYISSYPSVLRSLSLHTGTDPSQHYASVRIINLTSEMLDSHTRKLITQAFPQARIIETYTATEAGFMGYQCLDAGGFHLTEDLGIYELLPLENHPSLHQLIVTDLTNFATPLIRYSGLNDLVTAAPSPCACGSHHLRIENLHGRVIDTITLPDGSSVTPYLLTNIVAEIPGIQKYQIIQITSTEFHIKVVMDSLLVKSSSDQLATLQTEIQSAFQKALGETIRCQVSAIDDIQPQPGHHKIPLVVSQIGQS